MNKLKINTKNELKQYQDNKSFNEIIFITYVYDVMISARDK